MGIYVKRDNKHEPQNLSIGNVHDVVKQKKSVAVGQQIFS